MHAGQAAAPHFVGLPSPTSTVVPAAMRCVVSGVPSRDPIPDRSKPLLSRRNRTADREGECPNQIEVHVNGAGIHVDFSCSPSQAPAAHSMASRPVRNVGLKTGANFGE